MRWISRGTAPEPTPSTRHTLKSGDWVFGQATFSGLGNGGRGIRGGNQRLTLLAYGDAPCDQK